VTKGGQADTIQEPPFPANDRLRHVLMALVLFAVSIAVYIPAMNGGFIWDDDQEISLNKMIQAPDGLKNIWIDTWSDKTMGADFFPLKTTLQWVLWQIWGTNAPAFHVTNIVIHALCVVLLWFTLLRLRIPGAWLAALVWGLHPVNVESVAWLSELKNTLSLAFLLPAMTAFVRYEEEGSVAAYWGAVGLFLASLLSKTSVVTFPGVLLLYLWWKNSRLTVRDFKVCAPFFILAVALAVVTVVFQHGRAIGTEILPTGGPFTDPTGLSTPPPLVDYAGRLISACFATGFYLYQAAYPFHLLTIYPQWHVTLSPWVQVLPLLGYAALFVVAWRNRGTWGRHVIFGVGCFLLMLVPVLGVIKMSYLRLTLVADHFNYLSTISLVALVVSAFASWRNRHGTLASSTYALVGGMAVLLFSYMSFERSKCYKGMMTLWSGVLFGNPEPNKPKPLVPVHGKNPNTWQANNHMGALLYSAGQSDAAMGYFKRGVELKPYNCEVHNNYALALCQKGRFEEALIHYKRAVELKKDPSILTNYANALMQTRRFDEAVVQFGEAFKLTPDNPLLLLNMGNCLFQLDRIDEAVEAYRKALAMKPDFRDAESNLKLALRRKLELEKAAMPRAGGTGR
jgi:Tfp pilus assembly protein PilF